MMNVILAIHIIACLLLTGFVLIQKSEGGGLGMGGGGGGGNALLSGRGAAGAIVRMTMLVGVVFFVTSLTLTAIVSRSSDAPSAVDAALEAETETDDNSLGLDLTDPSAILTDDTEQEPSETVAPVEESSTETVGEVEAEAETTGDPQ